MAKEVKTDSNGKFQIGKIKEMPSAIDETIVEVFEQENTLDIEQINYHWQKAKDNFDEWTDIKAKANALKEE